MVRRRYQRSPCGTILIGSTRCFDYISDNRRLASGTRHAPRVLRRITAAPATRSTTILEKGLLRLRDANDPIAQSSGVASEPAHAPGASLPSSEESSLPQASAALPIPSARPVPIEDPVDAVFCGVDGETGAYSGCGGAEPETEAAPHGVGPCVAASLSTSAGAASAFVAPPSPSAASGNGLPSEASASPPSSASAIAITVSPSGASPSSSTTSARAPASSSTASASCSKALDAMASAGVKR